MKIQEIKDFIERPKLTMQNEDFVVPEEFLFLKPFFEKVEFVGTQSKHRQKYYKHFLLSDESKKEEGSHFTPEFITNIVNEYIKQSSFEFESVIDFTSGIGAFVFAVNNVKNKHVELWDINKKSLSIANVIAKKLDINIITKEMDTLAYARDNNEITFFNKDIPKFDLLVLNPPFNLDLKANTDFVKLALNMMKENSKAFIVLPNGFLNNLNKYNMEFRKFLVENKKIEAIFNLEGGIFENTSIPTTMFVLSNNNKEEIKIYDFSELSLPKIRVNTKINPLTKRVYYRDIKDYKQFKFDINKYEIPKNNDWLRDCSLISGRMLVDNEKEEQKMIDNALRVERNLKFLEKQNIKEKNKKLENLVKEMCELANKVNCSLLSEKGQKEALINYQLKEIEVECLTVEILNLLTNKELVYNDKNKMKEIYKNKDKKNNEKNYVFKIIKEALIELLI